jgi:hypothetical protein
MQRGKFTLKAKATFAIYLLSSSLQISTRAVAYAKQKTQCSTEAIKLYLIKTRATSIYSVTAASPFADIFHPFINRAINHQIHFTNIFWAAYNFLVRWGSSLKFVPLQELT